MLGRRQRKWNNPSTNELDLGGSNGSLGEFDERLQKAIDDTLALLGPIGWHKFSLRLKDEFNLELTSLASDPERLSSVLDQTLGPAGQFIGRAIVRKVAATYAINFHQDHGLTYADHVRELRQIVQQKADRELEASQLRVPTRIHASTAESPPAYVSLHQQHKTKRVDPVS